MSFILNHTVNEVNHYSIVKVFRLISKHRWLTRYTKRCTLKRLDFCLKSEIRVPLNKRRGVVEIFLLQKLFIMDHENQADVFWSSNFPLSLFRNLLLASIIISEQHFEYEFSSSLFTVDGFAQYFFESFDIFFKAAKILGVIHSGFT